MKYYNLDAMGEEYTLNMQDKRASSTVKDLDIYTLG